ncbi:MAG: hypothetical protein LPK09_14655 [Hymenobacteraceae bacterium]|nr:hypothetical protein [Hymenobacteraceae bacterium]
MNFIKKSFVVVALGLALVACKHDDEHYPPLNINYNAAYVVNGQDNNISVVNLAETKVSETIRLKDAVAPHHISLSPDKKTLAVAITSTDLSGGHAGHGAEGNFKVLILDAVTGLVTKTISLPKMPHNGAFNQSGTELWIGQAEDAGKVLVYSTSDWALKHTITVGKNPSEVTFSADGTQVYVANTDAASVTVINANNKTVRATLTVGTSPVGAWPASNGKMYVDNETAKSISVIDVASATVTETFSLGFKPGYAAYHSGTHELWVSDATNGKVVVYSHNGNNWAKKTDVATGADAHAIAFSDDLKLAYVTNQAAHTLSVVDAGTYTKVKDILVGKMPNGIVLR